MTDYRDVQNPSHSRSYDYSTMGSQKSPLTGILIALAVIAVVFLGLFMLGGTSTTTDINSGAPAVTEQSTAPAAPASE